MSDAAIKNNVKDKVCLKFLCHNIKICTLEALVKLSENYLCTDAITCPVNSPKLTEDIFISTLLLHAFSIVLRLDTFWLDFSPVYKKNDAQNDRISP